MEEKAHLTLVELLDGFECSGSQSFDTRKEFESFIVENLLSMLSGAKMILDVQDLEELKISMEWNEMPSVCRKTGPEIGIQKQILEIVYHQLGRSNSFFIH